MLGPQLILLGPLIRERRSAGGLRACQQHVDERVDEYGHVGYVYRHRRCLLHRPASLDGSMLSPGPSDSGTILKVDNVTSVSGNCGVVPTWSPDGSWIAWAGCEAQSKDLYVMKVDGSDLTEVPITPGSSDPVWQPASTS